MLARIGNSVIGLTLIKKCNLQTIIDFRIFKVSFQSWLKLADSLVRAAGRPQITGVKRWKISTAAPARFNRLIGL